MAPAEPISPELVLVSPELRERALEALPGLDAEALFAVAPQPVPPPAPTPVPRAEPARRGSLTVAFAAYLTEAVLLGAVRGALMVGLIALVAFLLAR